MSAGTPSSRPTLKTLTPGERLHIELIYSLPDHPDNHFGALYTSHATCYVHPILADIITTAASYLPEDQRLCVKDGLRTVDAQQGMADVKARRQWPDTLLSSPGEGAHPRACAVDIVREYRNNDGVYKAVDTGCHFDDFSLQDPISGEILPEGVDGMPVAHRNNPFISDEAYQAQCILECVMMRAALAHHVLIVPLASEHWDFRFPLSEHDLTDVLQSICRLCGMAPSRFIINNYDDFVMAWHSLFESSEQQAMLQDMLGVTEPPHPSGIIYAKDTPLWTDTDLKKQGYRPLTNLA